MTEPGQARLLLKPGAEPVSVVSGAFEGRPFTLDSPFRIASISKIMVAELARRLHAAGRLDMDADAGRAIAYPLQHPEFPDTPVTLRQLISHRSGIIDPAVYWMAGGGDIRSLLNADIWEPGVRPGAGFRYANLNSGLAATVMEAETGERFDRLFTQMIAEPMGLDIGYNWSGVSREKRNRGFPLMRGLPGAWDVQIDGSETLSDDELAILRQPGFDLADYVPGTNGTLFSPQGGLRASVNDLATIGREVLLGQPELWKPLWRMEDTDGRGAEAKAVEGRGDEAAHFVAFGDGVYLYPDGPLGDVPDTKWIGHHGEAYGFYGGLWVVPETGAVFVHADLGSSPDGPPMTGGRPNQTTVARDAFEWAYGNGLNSGTES